MSIKSAFFFFSGIQFSSIKYTFTLLYNHHCHPFLELFRHPSPARPRETEMRRGFVRNWGRREWGDEKALEMDGSDGCTTM